MSRKRLPPRDAASPRPDTTSVRLTRKYAEVIDGVDLSQADVGDRLELTPHEADMLIAEGWAEPASPLLRRRRAAEPRDSAPESSHQRRHRLKR